MIRGMGLMGLLAGIFCLVSGLQASELTDVQVVSGSGEVRLSLSSSAGFPEPTVFMTEQPPRIVVDLAETSSRVSGDRVNVAAGPVQSYQAMSAGGRTRLVVDLARPVPYEVEVAGDQLTLILQTGSVTAPTAAAPAARAVAGTDRMEITGIDFRRSPEGNGRVVIDLDRPGVNITVSERSTGLRVDMFDTRLPSQLYQRLDVTDFATPVQLITPEQRNENVRLMLEIAGTYEHLAFQTGNQLIIEISRPEEPAVERERALQFFGEREYEGARITLNFQDIQVRSVLQLIADVSDLNIVVSDSVSGSLTLRLTNVPWDQALDIVLETRNLDMRRSGNVIWIAPIAEIAAREQQILRARAEREALEPLRTVMLPIAYANASELAALVMAGRGEETGLLSNRGAVSVDERTNTLLVTDTLQHIDEIRDLVTELDRPVRQVLIESRIVIARHDFNYELGVRFGVSGARDPIRDNVVSVSGTSRSTDRMNNVALTRREFLGSRTGRPSFFPDADAEGGRLTIGEQIFSPALDDRLNVNLPVANPAGSLALSLLASDFLLDLELSALESDGRGEVISTPRLITANQQEAAIRQGVEIPFQTIQSVGGGAVPQIEFKQAELELKVRPLITPDNRVQLRLDIKQDTVGELFPTAGGNLVPSIDTRQLETNVLVDNGQTVVLGGIFQEERNFQTTKVPVLGDVPVMGHLFRRRSTDDQKRELLIFVTPSILDDRVVLD